MYRYRSTTISALFFLAAVLINPCFAEDAGPLDRFLAGINTFQGEFVQTLINKKGKEIERLSGVFQLKRPKQFYWLYETPYMQQIVINNDTVWFYDKELEQVIVKKMADSTYQTPAAIILEYKNAAARFDIKKIKEAEKNSWIELVPHDREDLYDKIHIGFSGGQLSTMRIFDKLGQITQLDFLGTKKNTVLDPRLFNFVPPAGVDIFDEREREAIY